MMHIIENEIYSYTNPLDIAIAVTKNINETKTNAILDRLSSTEKIVSTIVDTPTLYDKILEIM